MNTYRDYAQEAREEKRRVKRRVEAEQEVLKAVRAMGGGNPDPLVKLLTSMLLKQRKLW